MFQKQAFHSLTSAVFAVCFASFVTAEPLIQLSQTVAVDDELRPDALISGNWLVGVHTIAENTENVPKLYSYVPEGWNDKQVCVRVTGDKGRYTALYPYQMPDVWEGGLVEFIYPTQHPEFVQGFDHTNSGVAVQKGDCDTISETFLPALWNASENPIANAQDEVKLVLNINAGRADSVFGIAELGDIIIEMECEPTQARGVGFNYQCVFPVPRSQSAELKISIERLRFGRAAPSRSATIEFFPPVNNP